MYLVYIILCLIVWILHDNDLWPWQCKIIQHCRKLVIYNVNIEKKGFKFIISAVKVQCKFFDEFTCYKLYLGIDYVFHTTIKMMLTAGSSSMK